MATDKKAFILGLILSPVGEIPLVRPHAVVLADNLYEAADLVFKTGELSEKYEQTFSNPRKIVWERTVVQPNGFHDTYRMELCGPEKVIENEWEKEDDDQ